MRKPYFLLAIGCFAAITGCKVNVSTSTLAAEDYPIDPETSERVDGDRLEMDAELRQKHSTEQENIRENTGKPGYLDEFAIETPNGLPSLSDSGQQFFDTFMKTNQDNLGLTSEQLEKSDDYNFREPTKKFRADFHNGYNQLSREDQRAISKRLIIGEKFYRQKLVTAMSNYETAEEKGNLNGIIGKNFTNELNKARGDYFRRHLIVR